MYPSGKGFVRPQEKRVVVYLQMTEGEPYAFSFLVTQFMQEHLDDQLKNRHVVLETPESG